MEDRKAVQNNGWIVESAVGIGMVLVFLRLMWLVMVKGSETMDSFHAAYGLLAVHCFKVAQNSFQHLDLDGSL